MGVLALALALTACASEGDFGTGGMGSPSPTRSEQTRPTSTGTVTIIEPAEGSTVEGPNVTVKVRVDGATILLSGEASRDVRPDTGHVHILQKTFGASGPGRTETLLAGEEYTIENLAPGRYIITAEFAAADHGSFDPPVLDSVTITVT